MCLVHHTCTGWSVYARVTVRFLLIRRLIRTYYIRMLWYLYLSDRRYYTRVLQILLATVRRLRRRINQKLGDGLTATARVVLISNKSSVK